MTVLSWGARLLVWVFIAISVAVIAAAVVVPRVSGATPYTILTGSMQPDLPPGTLVVVRSVDVDTLGVGDVVTVQLESGRPQVVTHRIAAVEQRLDGTTQFRTKGDANDSVDLDPRRPEQIRGELWYAVPYVGHVSQLLTGSTRQTAVVVIAVGLLGYAALMFVGAERDRRRGDGGSGRRAGRRGERTGGRHAGQRSTEQH